MLDGFIIEEIKRREQERLRRERKRPTLEIPVYRDDRDDEDRRRDKSEAPKAPDTVVHINFQ